MQHYLFLLFSNIIRADIEGPNLGMRMKRSLVQDSSAYGGNSSFRTWLSHTLNTYDNRLRPYFGNKALKISLRFWLIGISQISEKHMSFTMEMFFHETWTDPRLKFDSKLLDGYDTLTLPLDAQELLWVPDTSFLNALRSTFPKRGSVSHLYYMKLYNNGTITRSRRISVTAQCKMDLTMYPFDQQICRLELSSYGWTVNDIVYEWSWDKRGISIDTLSLQDYQVKRYVIKVRNRTFHAGPFSSPQMCIELRRRSGYYFMQLIIPATAVVGSTWISLWLESETKFGDLVAVILAIIFLSYSYNTMMPKVSYVKALDIYMAACFLFTFLSLIKLAVVKYLRKKVIKNKEKRKLQQIAEAANKRHARPTFEGPYGEGDGDKMKNEPHPFEATEALEPIAEIDIESTPSTPFLERKLDNEKISPGSNVITLSPDSAVIKPEPPQFSTRKRSTFPTIQKRRIRTGPSILLRNLKMHYNVHDYTWRYLKAFHVISQLILPLLFVAFGLFYFFIYPYFGAYPICN